MDHEDCHDTEEEMELEEELFASVPFQLNGTLAPETTDFLTTLTAQREEKNIPKVLSDLEDIEFFQKFPNAVKKKLCKKMVFVSFPGNEYLLRQGEDVEGMFVLLSGVVNLRYNILTPHCDGGAETQWPERVLIRGDYFGQADLLRRKCASVDAYTLCYSELLLLKEEDFDIVRNSLKSEQICLKRSILSTELLRKFRWSEEERGVLEMFSKTRKYDNVVEIYNGPSGAKPKWSHFLVKGECKLARDVNYYVLDSGTPNMRFEAVGVGELPRQKVLTKSLKFESVKQNFFFGVGEDLGRNRIFSNPASEFLLVMRLVLVFKNKQFLEQMADHMTRSLPSDQLLLDTFLEHERAANEVENLIEGMLEDKSKRLTDGGKIKPKSPFRKCV